MNLTDTNILAALPLSRPSAATTTITGAAFNLAAYEGVLKVVQEVGVVSGTTPTLNGKIQTSADGSTGWTDIAGAIFAQVSATNSSQSIQIDTRNQLGYIRYFGTITGTTPVFNVSVEAIAAPKRL